MKRLPKVTGRCLPALCLPVLGVLIGAVSCAPPAPRASMAGGSLLIQERYLQPIYALDAKTGKTLVSMPGEGWIEAGAVRDGVAFMHGRGGLVARDIATGEPRWRTFMHLGSAWKIVIGKDVVFAQQRFIKGGFSRPETSWVGLDIKTGIKRFELSTDARAPLAANDDVAVTFEQGELVGYNVNDGKERWRSTVEARGPLFIEGGRLYARTEDQLAIFSAASGALQRKVDLGGTDAFGGLRPTFAARGNLFAWIEASVLHVADATSGKEAWRREGVEAIAVCGNTLVTGAGGRLAGLDLATGTERWKADLDADEDTLAGADDAVSVRLDSTHIAVLDAATGRERFVFDVEKGAADASKAGAPPLLPAATLPPRPATSAPPASSSPPVLAPTPSVAPPTPENAQPVE